MLGPASSAGWPSEARRAAETDRRRLGGNEATWPPATASTGARSSGTLGPRPARRPGLGVLGA